MKVIILATLLFLVSFVSASSRFGHHSHHKPPTSVHKQCHFQSDKGSYDLRLLMRDMNGKDWELRDEKSGSTFFFNPCGGVQNKACPPGSALCEITNKQLALSYGSSEEMNWNEGQDASVELTYANGEKCDNGIPRKTLVQMTCSKPTSDKITQQTVITDMSIDECFITLKMTSPYACAIEQLCSVYDKEECEASQGLCGWQNGEEGKCVVTTDDCFQFGRHHLSLAAVIGLFGGLSVLAFCGLTLCCCVCCAKRRRNRAKAPLPTKVKKSKRASKNEEELSELPPTQFIYQPLQQMQGYPGNYMGVELNPSLNPYTPVQFIPNTSVQN